jgi:hypothetical protein
VRVLGRVASWAVLALIALPIAYFLTGLMWLALFALLSALGFSLWKQTEEIILPVVLTTPVTWVLLLAGAAKLRDMADRSAEEP